MSLNKLVEEKYLQKVIPCLANGFGYEEYQQAVNLLCHSCQYTTREELHALTMNRIRLTYSRIVDAFDLETETAEE